MTGPQDSAAANASGASAPDDSALMALSGYGEEEEEEDVKLVVVSGQQEGVESVPGQVSTITEGVPANSTAETEEEANGFGSTNTDTVTPAENIERHIDLASLSDVSTSVDARGISALGSSEAAVTESPQEPTADMCFAAESHTTKADNENEFRTDLDF